MKWCGFTIRRIFTITVFEITAGFPISIVNLLCTYEAEHLEFGTLVGTAIEWPLRLNPINDKRGAAVKFPPPLIFLFWMFAGYVMEHYWPAVIVGTAAFTPVGVVITAAGVGILALAILSLKRAETNVEPWRPTRSIVSTGVFACSRNPIYLGFCIVAIGMGIILNSVWVSLSFVPSAAMVYFVAIRKEEAYLERKFGEEYVEYRARVRRWF